MSKYFYIISLAIVSIVGCRGGETPAEAACRKLLIQCEKKNESEAIVKKIEEQTDRMIEERLPRLRKKIDILNNQISSYVKDGFSVGLIGYQNIIDLKSDISQRIRGTPRVEQLNVYSEPFLLSDPEYRNIRIGFSAESPIKVRGESRQAANYRVIDETCAKFTVGSCSISYRGKLEGVWTTDPIGRMYISGWIDLDEVIVNRAVQVDTTQIKADIQRDVSVEFLRLIYEKNDSLSWNQLEKLVDEKMGLNE